MVFNREINTKISSPARLHIGLHDCGYATDRVFGGVGVIIDGVPTTVECAPSSKVEVNFGENINPSERTIQAVDSLLSELEQIFGPVNATVHSMAPEHMGLGSKTSLLLALAQSAFMAHGLQFGSNFDEIVKTTGRGGTSGIGVNGFIGGGLIVDGGHATIGSTRNFSPSSGRLVKEMAPVISRVAMPSSWRTRLYYDPEFIPIEGDKEKNLFKNLMPLPAEEIYRSMATTFHSIIPAVLGQDLHALGIGLREMNSIGMKRREIDLQTQKTRNFLKYLWESQIAAGLSSFGPTIFTVLESGQSDSEMIHSMAFEYGMDYFGEFEFNNHGAVINHDSTII